MIKRNWFQENLFIGNNLFPRTLVRWIGIVMGGSLLITLLWGPLHAMDWPSEDGVMVNNFGSNQEGKPLLGTVFETDGVVRATEEGEILFIHQTEDCASRLPSPLGTWVALDHGNGLVSIYSRLDDSADIPLLDQVTRGRVIAQAGQSGWSGKEGFYFSFFDRKERRWINPSMIITPPEDTTPPSIYSVELKNADGQLINPAQTRNIRQGRYTILVNATDSVKAGGVTLAPDRILCSVNGMEIGALNFEAYSARDGVLMAYRNGLVPVKQIYAPHPAFEVGELWLTRGQATLEIIAEDINKNTRNMVFRLQVE
ncbi:hypothetical protein FACS1894130_01090 [Spirochaetia bacterium]|nr:hypothetical protein FACS1894130_01090 [Spirochaetia bacterium]